jgi:hypothetical protein
VIWCDEGGCGIDRLHRADAPRRNRPHPAEDERTVEAFDCLIDPAHFDQTFAEMLQGEILVIGGLFRHRERERRAEDRFCLGVSAALSARGGMEAYATEKPAYAGSNAAQSIPK